MVVVLQDYPSSEISEPIYRIGEKLRLIAQYDPVLMFHDIRPSMFAVS